MPRIIFTLSKELKEALKKKSKGLDISMSAYIRMKLAEALRDEIES